MPNKIPRKAIKDILKEKSNMRIGANADLMVQLDMLLFLHRLVEESRAKAFEEKSATISAHHVQAVSKKVLKSVRGDHTQGGSLSSSFIGQWLEDPKSRNILQRW